MGIVESVRAVMWARKHQPQDVAYGIALGHERFSPGELLDHCASAWVWLGAAGQATSQVSLGPAVSAIVHRYNPVVMAQQAATLELMNPGRAFLAIITRMLHGETVSYDGRYFRAREARLYDLPPRRIPVYMSAFGPKAAAIAGRLADGVWTLAHPVKAPKVIAAYRKAAEEAGREPGEIILQGVAAAAETEDLALQSSREWKGTLVDESYADDVSDPARVGELGEENVSDRKYKTVMNVSGADPLGTVRLYGAHVLPELRG